MFSLIITIVAIALVALLALATLYYGGSSFQKGDAAAKAAKLLNEGQQLMGAADIYRADKGVWPESIEVLIAENYLTATPTNRVSLMGVEFDVPQIGISSANAADPVSSAWAMPKPGHPTFQIAQASTDVCAEVNRKSYGVAGVLAAPRSFLINQCYGLGSPQFTMLVSKEPKGLVDIPPISDVVIADPLPTDADSNEWTVKPGQGGLVGLPSTGTDTGTPPVVDAGKAVDANDPAIANNCLVPMAAYYPMATSYDQNTNFWAGNALSSKLKTTVNRENEFYHEWRGFIMMPFKNRCTQNIVVDTTSGTSSNDLIAGGYLSMSDYWDYAGPLPNYASGTVRLPAAESWYSDSVNADGRVMFNIQAGDYSYDDRQAMGPITLTFSISADEGVHWTTQTIVLGWK